MKIDAYELDDTAVELIKQVRKVFPSAVIAGGFVRDAVMGEPPKDLDIFVSSDRQRDFVNSLRGVDNGFDRPWFEDVKGHLASYTNYVQFNDGARYVVCIADYAAGEVHPTLPVQVIAMQKQFTPLELVGEFDIGLCMVAFDGSRVHTDPRFSEDFDNNRLTIHRAMSEGCFKRTKRRVRRFLDKYTTLDREFSVYTTVNTETGKPRNKAVPFDTEEFYTDECEPEDGREDDQRLGSE